jgi:peptide/nickel transport system ATP-binding protein
MKENKPLLQIEKGSVTFWTENGHLNAVHDIDLSINKGEVVAIVGESGSGKSVTAESILRLHDKKNTEYSGKITFEDQDLLTLSEKKLRQIRGKEISMIFQDPLDSLNPAFRIGQQLVETIRLHQKVSKNEAKRIALEALDATGIPNPLHTFNDYPHQLSGGMQQRVMIALAISCDPKLIIADEPTTALDVTLQARILNVLKRLKEEIETAILFITHDLGVVAEIADRVVVMYAGEIVEVASVEELFDNPKHPYTRALLRAIPQLEGTETKQNRLFEIKGRVPSLNELPKGCRFASRAEGIPEEAHEEVPIMHEISNGHFVRCTCYKYIENQLEGEESIHEHA